MRKGPISFRQPFSCRNKPCIRWKKGFSGWISGGGSDKTSRKRLYPPRSILNREGVIEQEEGKNSNKLIWLEDKGKTVGKVSTEKFSTSCYRQSPRVKGNYLQTLDRTKKTLQKKARGGKKRVFRTAHGRTRKWGSREKIEKIIGKVALGGRFTYVQECGHCLAHRLHGKKPRQEEKGEQIKNT